MLRVLLLLLLLFTSSENVVPTGIDSSAGGASVNVYMFTLAGMFVMVCDAVAMVGGGRADGLAQGHRDRAVLVARRAAARHQAGSR